MITIGIIAIVLGLIIAVGGFFRANMDWGSAGNILFGLLVGGTLAVVGIILIILSLFGIGG